MALVAQQEREAISKRARAAPAAARARGVKLGNPNGAAALTRAGQGGAPLRAAVAANADRHAQDLAPVAADIRAGGATRLRAIAAELDARGMLTRCGGRWHVLTVTNLLERLGLSWSRPWLSQERPDVQPEALSPGKEGCGLGRPTQDEVNRNCL